MKRSEVYKLLADIAHQGWNEANRHGEQLAAKKFHSLFEELSDAHLDRARRERELFIPELTIVKIRSTGETGGEAYEVELLNNSVVTIERHDLDIL